MTIYQLSDDQFTPANCALSFNRVGYGAMQLAGPHVWGPPKDRAGAVAVLRDAMELGINHIDTSDFYGPHVTNQIIREALHPYFDGLTIVTKIGFRRGEDESWIPSHSAQELRAAVHDNLRNLQLDVLDVVNLRAPGITGPDNSSLAASMETLVRLKQEGLIRYIGLSNVTAEQVAEAQQFTDIVCVQNQYNLAHRDDDALIDTLAAQKIAFVPFFPLGGFTPLQSDTLTRVAASMQVNPMQVALAWLLQRAPNILVIPGTKSIAHLRENVLAGALQLDAEALIALNNI
ncbi:oxidoreductase [Glaciimonas sp. CA11.2]|uniref:oxidoreductase n=1 Tax=unclassified Glaciimonas TaxID=2644401 RepID=UPI002AB5C0D6|nr:MULTISPECIES: oxidoreductase [unclassified Glaciimonas]MDY7548320.1 oxidoreductase [Glaciimonas sp. CA11.2]MEB0010530.1 oxidoreductase [Glaciimonas sp. Cout2]MEB0083520.1 oxidoreductase [Glaciimonas sp. Gout2]MEB0162353.1 oxidoreductase [Glaciimonas sp. CA11.2]